MHPLINIMVIAVCDTLCGADGWVSIEDWAKAKIELLRELLDDMFGRVFSILSPTAFQAAFLE
ncbi:MAG: hypothetical protein ACJATT_003542 [Myxococcota bacterium]